MARISSDDLGAIKKLRAANPCDFIRVGMSTCGIAAGADKVFRVFGEEIKKRGSAIDLRKCGCLGMCHAEPLVEVAVAGMPRVIYSRVDENCAREIFRRHIEKHKILQDFVIEMQSEDAQ
ncbi:MAG: (2Fe-2S) ferredoxin domain-containing protein [Deltaproteobacteria bacterium]|nr:(2Fe-2S) ferredoxin domain-containing protein [Deltaproteobacteria bacterium]